MKKKHLYISASIMTVILFILLLSFGIPGWGIASMILIFGAIAGYVIYNATALPEYQFIDLAKLREQPKVSPQDSPTIAGNALICNFMDEVFEIRHDTVMHCTFNEWAKCGRNPEGAIWEEVKYDKSWDWLVEVIKKIRKKEFETQYGMKPAGRSYYYLHNIVRQMADLDIDKTWKAVVHLLEYYKQQETQCKTSNT